MQAYSSTVILQALNRTLNYLLSIEIESDALWREAGFLCSIPYTIYN